MEYLKYINVTGLIIEIALMTSGSEGDAIRHALEVVRIY